MPSTIGLYSGTTAPEVAGTNTTSLYGGSGVPVPGANGNTVIRGDLTVTGDASIQGELTVGDDLCIEGDFITLRCNATTIGDATIEVERGASTNAAIAWTEADTSWHSNFAFEALGLQGGDVVIAPSGFDNLITTESGSSQSLRLDSDTGAIEIDAADLTLAQATTLFYSEANNRLNRPNFQSTTGNSSGMRVIGPNTTTSSRGVITAYSSSDLNNGSFVNIQAINGGTDPLRIQTGTYTGGVIGPSSTSLAFIDNATTYATVNPAGPSAATDLVTVAFLSSATIILSQVNIDNRVYLDSLELTTSTTTANQTLDSFVAATYRNAKYQISISSGSDVQTMEVLVTHDGTTAYQTVYADMSSAASLTNIGVTLSGGNVILQVTPTNAVTTYKVSRTLIVV